MGKTTIQYIGKALFEIMKLIHSSYVKLVIDNKLYQQYIPIKKKCKVEIIPYGGTIDKSKRLDKKILTQYPFIKNEYFLSISRSIEDNKLKELCETFLNLNKNLVLISNFSNSFYGKNILKSYSQYRNIYLIDGLYDKPILDLIRRKCFAYIHTRTLCGTAPSLVEMIKCERPILSIDVPQNRFTMDDMGNFFSRFSELRDILSSRASLKSIKSPELLFKYSWSTVVKQYENLYK